MSIDPSANLSTDDADNTRRQFLRLAGGGMAAIATGAWAAATPEIEANKVTLPPLNAPTEQQEKPQDPSAPPARRVGFAIVGLGHLSLNQILPAFGKSKYAYPAALVSGDPVKARKIAAQYGIDAASIYNYQNYDELAHNPRVDVVYVVLPNSMHREFTVRAAKAGKHVLCEKPMATSVADCEAMIAACAQAGRKLMIGYRSQYEPHSRALVKLLKQNKLGELREFISANSQNEGDPTQWRLKKAMAGGGPLPDVGIYSINQIRFLTGLEPEEVFATTYAPSGDPRFTEVEASIQYTLRFPGGLSAACSSAYNSHKSQFFRVQGSTGWAEMSPAFAYNGLKLRTNQVMDGNEVTQEPAIAEKDQFALELDHMAQCVLQNLTPHTPGEEGLRDQQIIEALYESARTHRPVKVPPVKGPLRGPEPAESA
ncbi:Gfo/Idh/MocA family protein [Amantichitinum ursilacus]|uniref:Glucose--fructose oxidoreductase n=1 Tax=Amantichitinum ursilacus TaxID=857265 RepID=A0A0N0GM95_9NEIS|nr:Gfo/Idh/MocA family oxidoreductase [Amantichitinum ursilacus]KPC50715.1 Glucose--fructose oxidoreductase precursor [Amantichitinum ursilacus]